MVKGGKIGQEMMAQGGMPKLKGRSKQNKRVLSKKDRRKKRK